MNSLITNCTAIGFNGISEEDTISAGNVSISNEELNQILIRLKKAVEKRKPKDCAIIKQDIIKYNLPTEYCDAISKVINLIDKYRFKDADLLLSDLIEKTC